MLPMELAKLAAQQQKRYEADFKEVGMIGKGGFSKVYKVLNQLDKNHYAIKKVELRVKDIRDSFDKNLQRVMRGTQFIYKFHLEARYLARLSHPRIIRYFNSWVEVVQSSKPKRDRREQAQPKVQEEVLDFDSPAVSRNDLDNVVFFQAKEEVEEALSYSQIEIPFQNGRNGKARKNGKFQEGVSKKSISQQQSKAEYGPLDEFEKIIFYIQTEICEQTLDQYLVLRNAELSRYRKKDQQKYNELLNKSDIEGRVILKQVVEGLEYIHQQCKLMHRDLKPGNIFMNSAQDVKIGDFGLVSKIQYMFDNSEDTIDELRSPMVSSRTCTQMYASPEQVSSNVFDHRSDIHALGLIILQLFHPMFTQMEIIKTMQEARKGILPQALLDREPLICEMILLCLKVDPKQRPTLKQITMSIAKKVDGSPIHQRSNGIASQSTADSLAGDCHVGIDDEEYQKRFITFNGLTLQIYKSNGHQKAQMIYNISECSVELCDDHIKIQHHLLVGITLKPITHTTQEIYTLMSEITII